jgi:hypothetical protein
MNHSQIDERSRAFGELIAARLLSDPSLVKLAQTNIDRWMATTDPRSAAALEEWRRILEGPVDYVVELLVRTDEYATRMRQSNPFAGALTLQERNAVIRQFKLT